jgi:hypothetical protein
MVKGSLELMDVNMTSTLGCDTRKGNFDVGLKPIVRARGVFVELCSRGKVSVLGAVKSSEQMFWCGRETN